MPPREAHGLCTWESRVVSAQEVRNFFAHVLKEFPIDLDSRRLNRGHWTSHLCSWARRDNAAVLYSRRGRCGIVIEVLGLSQCEGVI